MKILVWLIRWSIIAITVMVRLATGVLLVGLAMKQHQPKGRAQRIEAGRDYRLNL